MNLLNGSGTTIATTTTDSNGLYTFTNLSAGDYQVEVDTSTLPTGLYQTFDVDGVGTSPDISSHTLTEITNANGIQTGVTINATQDFGYNEQGLGSIGNYVWYDSNEDGVQDLTESALPNITLNLLNGSGTTIGTTTTDSNGLYTFTDLEAGIYTVVVDTTTIPTDMLQTYDVDGIT